MIQSEVRRFIQQEIRRQMNIVLSGKAGANDQFTETIDEMFPGMPGMLSRPVMHPYGLVSRAPMGTLSVTARQGDHTGNRLVLGHRDVNRPSLEEGEVQLYNEFGQAVYLKNGSVHLGEAGASNPAVLGDELKAFLSDLIQWLLTHTHVGNLGAPTSPAQEAADLQQIQAQNIDNDKILSQLVFLLKGGG